MDTVHAWVFSTQVPDAALETLWGLLDREDRRCAAAAPPPARRRVVAARGAARVIIGGHLGTDPARLRWRRRSGGRRPELAGAATGVRVSLSCSGDRAALAVVHGRPVGVSLQYARPVDAAPVAGRFFLPHEARLVTRDDRPVGQRDRFLRLWVRKAACRQAAGATLFAGLRLPVAGTGPCLVVHGGPSAPPGPFQVHDLSAPEGYHLAVALAGRGACRVVPHG